MTDDDEIISNARRRLDLLTLREALYQRLVGDIKAARLEMETTASDRATVLVCFALVDRAIFETLSLFLADCEDTIRLLSAEGGALGPFAHRVRLCVSLGLIPKELGDAARELAKIRNHFAHTLDYSFGNKYESALSKAERFVQLTVTGDFTPTQRYRIICAQIAFHISQLWTEGLVETRCVVPPFSALA